MSEFVRFVMPTPPTNMFGKLLVMDCSMLRKHLIYEQAKIVIVLDVNNRDKHTALFYLYLCLLHYQMSL